MFSRCIIFHQYQGRQLTCLRYAYKTDNYIFARFVDIIVSQKIPWYFMLLYADLQTKHFTILVLAVLH